MKKNPGWENIIKEHPEYDAMEQKLRTSLPKLTRAQRQVAVLVRYKWSSVEIMKSLFIQEHSV